VTREGSIRVGDRTITYLEAGDPGGPLVLHNHGGPSSRLEAELFDPYAKANGLRFVCADRPGMGGSDLQRGRTFEGWTGDLLLLADSFGAHRFAVTGWSEGGPWALAAAAYLDPARLVNVVCIAGGNYGTFGSNWAAKYLSSVDALGGRLALHFHPGFTLMYDVLGISATHFADRYAKAITQSACTADREVLADEKVTMLYKAWPFDMTTVTRPVHFWQGSADTLVPEIINKTVADKTPGAVWHPISGGGHFIAVSHANHILALVASDLAPVEN
jgi:pimeloyl-ACP methyl ester carboxylesterase